MRKAITRRSFLAASTCCLAVLTGQAPPARGAIGNARLGVAVTPRNTPLHNPAELDEAFGLAKQLGDHAVFIFQWGELDLRIAKILTEKARRAGLSPLLGLSPTTLDQGRKELDIPDDVRRRAGAAVSFANPAIRAAFKDAAKDLAKLRPPYLCLATEINFLAMQRLEEFLHFASLYKEAYRAVKRISPATKVFVSFQWEWMRILDAKEPGKIKEHSKLIDIFRPELDQIGLTTYPSAFHDTPLELLPDYFTWVYRHIGPADQVLLMEVGWPTAGSGNELEQVLFIKRLPELLREVNLSVLAWALLHDVKLAEFDADLNTVGLLSHGGRRKAGHDAFRELGG